MTNRYDSAAYLEAYRDRRAYPAIHDALFGLVFDRSREARFLDLCCGTGLLGERVFRRFGAAFVLGVDASAASIGSAAAHGVSIPIARLDISPGTLATLGGLIADNGIKALVARRCLPELIGDRPEMQEALVGTLASSGIIEVFLQGRVVSGRSTNRLASVDREIAALAAHYTPAVRRGPCCLLRLR